jgi:hypothetical protein
MQTIAHSYSNPHPTCVSIPFDSPDAQIFSPIPNFFHHDNPSSIRTVTATELASRRRNLDTLANSLRSRHSRLSSPHPFSTMPTTATITTQRPSNNNHEVIDLTSDDSPSPADIRQALQPWTMDYDDGLRLPPHDQRPNLGTASRGPRFANNINIIDLEDEEIVQNDDDIVFMGSRARPQPAPQQQPMRSAPGPEVEIIAANNLETHHSFLRSSHQLFQRMTYGFESMLSVLASENGTARSYIDDFPLPNMDYTVPGFQFGMEDPDRTESTSPAAYSAPVAAPAGFTRSPQDDDTLICPKCHDVLCEGDSDLKKQVWAVRSCGHVS